MIFQLAVTVLVAQHAFAESNRILEFTSVTSYARSGAEKIRGVLPTSRRHTAEEMVTCTFCADDATPSAKVENGTIGGMVACKDAQAQFPGMTELNDPSQCAGVQFQTAADCGCPAAPDPSALPEHFCNMCPSGAAIPHDKLGADLTELAEPFRLNRKATCASVQLLYGFALKPFDIETDGDEGVRYNIPPVADASLNQLSRYYGMGCPVVQTIFSSDCGCPEPAPEESSCPICPALVDPEKVVGDGMDVSVAPEPGYASFTCGALLRTMESYQEGYACNTVRDGAMRMLELFGCECLEEKEQGITVGIASENSTEANGTTFAPTSAPSAALKVGASTAIAAAASAAIPMLMTLF